MKASLLKTGQISCGSVVLVALFIALCTGQSVQAVTLYAEDFNSSNGGFTLTTSAVDLGSWSYDSASGTCLTSGPGDECSETPKYSSLTSPAINVASDGNLTLSFEHRYSFEYDGSTRWDGGQVLISLNGGPAAVVSNFTQNGYDGIIQGNTIINGQYGFNSTSSGYSLPSYITSIAELGFFNAGDIFNIIFLATWDECAMGLEPNWQINSLQIDTDAAPVPEPSTFILFGAGLAGLVVWRRKRN